jgi:hypothetical protein
MSNNFELLVLLVIFAVYAFVIKRAKDGKVPEIRMLPCLEAMPEAIQRAAEMGTSIHFATGNRGLDHPEAPVAVAGIAMLGYAAELCGRYKVPIHYTCIWGYMIPIAQDTIRRGYELGGNPEMYSDDMIEYTGNDQRAYGACLGAGAVIGAMQLAGTSRIYYQPFMVATCDYSFIGDELYAAAAKIGDVPEELAIIQAIDITKAISIILLVLSVILTVAGTDFYSQLIGW